MGVGWKSIYGGLERVDCEKWKGVICASGIGSHGLKYSG